MKKLDKLNAEVAKATAALKFPEVLSITSTISMGISASFGLLDHGSWNLCTPDENLGQLSVSKSWSGESTPATTPNHQGETAELLAEFVHIIMLGPLKIVLRFQGTVALSTKPCEFLICKLGVVIEFFGTSGTEGAAADSLAMLFAKFAAEMIDLVQQGTPRPAAKTKIGEDSTATKPARSKIMGLLKGCVEKFQEFWGGGDEENSNRKELFVALGVEQGAAALGMYLASQLTGATGGPKIFQMMRTSLSFQFDLTAENTDDKKVKIQVLLDFTVMYGFEMQIPTPIGAADVGVYITLGNNRDIAAELKGKLNEKKKKGEKAEDDSEELTPVKENDSGFIAQTGICVYCSGVVDQLREDGSWANCGKEDVNCNWLRKSMAFALNSDGTSSKEILKGLNRWLLPIYGNQYKMLVGGSMLESPLQFPVLKNFKVSQKDINQGKVPEQQLDRLNLLLENPPSHEICKQLFQICQPGVEVYSTPEEREKAKTAETHASRTAEALTDTNKAIKK